MYEKASQQRRQCSAAETAFFGKKDEEMLYLYTPTW
jgi:hypothetical protein